MNNILIEFKILSDFLKEAIKVDEEVFKPISNEILGVINFDFINVNKVKLETIENDFNKIISHLSDLGVVLNLMKYYPFLGGEIKEAIDTPVLLVIKAAKKLYTAINLMTDEEFKRQLMAVPKNAEPPPKKETAVFIGHGRSPLWSKIELFLNKEFNIPVFTFETETRTSETIINILNGFLEKATFAILILTAEDEVANGSKRARQNVIHEAGLFQGKLGFENVVILKQKNTEDLSNLAGLQFIQFENDNIEQVFYNLQRILKKQNIV